MANPSEFCANSGWIKKSADLSRLKFSNEELSELSPELGQILNYIDQLQKVPSEGVAPWVHPLVELFPESCRTVFRSDVVTQSEAARNKSEEILAIAPQISERSFQVPEAVQQTGSRSK